MPHCVIGTERNHPNAFAVILMMVPFFPGPVTKVKPDVTRYAVVAAMDDKGAWGYVDLNREWKDVIGQAMLDLGCREEQWYWCEYYEDEIEEDEPDEN